MIRASAKRDTGTRKLRSPVVRETIAKNLRQARWNAGVAQIELGEKLGVSQQAIEAFETGRKQVSCEALALLAHALRVDIGAMFRRGGIPATRGKPPKDLRTTGRKHLE